MKGKELGLVVVSYYESIFQSSGCLRDHLFSNLQPRLTSAKNDGLMCHFRAKEVCEAVFAMFPNKAPGPNGINPGFF